MKIKCYTGEHSLNTKASNKGGVVGKRRESGKKLIKSWPRGASRFRQVFQGISPSLLGMRPQTATGRRLNGQHLFLTVLVSARQGRVPAGPLLPEAPSRLHADPPGSEVSFTRTLTPPASSTLMTSSPPEGPTSQLVASATFNTATWESARTFSLQPR